MVLMFDDEFVVIVVDGNGAEAFHSALAEKERCSLVVDHGDFDIFEEDIAYHYFSQGDDGSGTEFTGGYLVVTAAFYVFVGQVAVLEHEVSFNRGDGDIGSSCVKDHLQRKAVDLARDFEGASSMTGEGNFGNSIFLGLRNRNI